MKTVQVQLDDIIVSKIWKDNNKEPRNHSPVLDYCRKLIKEGEKYGTCLEVYRNDLLLLKVPRIGKGAKLTIREDDKRGPEFVEYRSLPQFKMAGIVTR